MLERYARKLLGKTVENVCRFSVASEEGAIRLLDTLVLVTSEGFVTLTYAQEGLSCGHFATEDELRWTRDVELSFGRAEGVQEWLELTVLDADDKAPNLPFLVTGMAGWFGDGAYEDVFALTLSGDSRQLVLLTTDSFDLMCADVPAALARAEKVAANMNQRIVREDLRLET